MPELNYAKTLNTFNDFSGPIIRDVYLNPIYNAAFLPERSLMASKIPRSSEGVGNNLRVRIPFITRYPWSWRHLNAQDGYTPVGGKFAAAEQYAQLSSHAACATASLEEIVMMQSSANAWTDIITAQMEALGKTFPMYMLALLWTSQGGMKALGKAASISGTTVTLNNTGLWNTTAGDRAKLFEIGMVVQVYHGTAKLGAPVTITGVDRFADKIILDADPGTGITANDIFVCSDLGGMETPYNTDFPGLLDVIDDDNTFQGIDRSAEAGRPFRALVESASGKTLGYELLSEFFAKLRNPKYAFTGPALLRNYWKHTFATNVRFTQGGTFEEGFQYIDIDGTRLVGEDDCDRDQIIVPDFANMQIAELGAFKNLFGDGWTQIPGRTIIEYPVVWWGLLLAKEVHKMGRMHTISLLS